MGLIRSVDIKTFVLTDLGRASSIVTDGADTSGHLVFDYQAMDVGYGRQVFSVIRSTLLDARARCSFYHGDVSCAVLVDIRKHCKSGVHENH